MSLLSQVHDILVEVPIAHALIGAAAMAVHGVSRSTFDLDLLAVDLACLDRALWQPLEAAGVAVEVRRGDADDPLAGVVRFEAARERPVDLIVGASAWQSTLIERAESSRIGDVEVPVVAVAGLVLLKLYAGGPQDRWDIEQLLADERREAVAAEVETSLAELPERCRELWRSFVAARPGG